jgi:hypothetical protein
MVVWPYPRWKDWRERHKDRYADIDERFVVKKGTKRDMKALADAFRRLQE